MNKNNFYVLTSEEHKPIKMWTRGVPIEDKAIEQLKNVASLPFIFSHVAAMPDVHWGAGATVGSVIATQGAVVPSCIGSDIGCGVAATRLTGITMQDLPGGLELVALRHEIEDRIPTGFKAHPFHRIAQQEDIMDYYEVNVDPILDFIEAAHPNFFPKRKNEIGDYITTQFGTLGGGNHFIEICYDQDHNVWLLLHSGSRRIGKELSDYFIALAKADMEKYFITLPDDDLAYFPSTTQHYEDYMLVLDWAQGYARQNRERMLDVLIEMMQEWYGEDISEDLRINCHHNYAAIEHHFKKNVLITRKGATRARDGEWGIIPGSMGDNSYIVQGKGNPQSFHSCSHGAGRAMGRREAKRTFTVQDHIEATAGVECRKDGGVLDETPRAYKEIEDVMAAQTDLVSIEYELAQVVCVKG